VHGVESLVDYRGRSLGEDGFLGLTDVEALKHGEQTGLETPVVHALNDDCLILDKSSDI